MLGMKKSGRRLLVVPAAQAYGGTGQPPKVAPNATLLYEVQPIRVRNTFNELQHSLRIRK